MLVIATDKEVAHLLFYTPTQYGSDRFRQIFIDHWEWQQTALQNSAIEHLRTRDSMQGWRGSIDVTALPFPVPGHRLD